MSLERLKAFLAKVKGDSNLQEQINIAESSKDVLAIAKEAGFSISADDLKKAHIELEWAELSDEELEGVTGGKPSEDSVISTRC